MPSLLNPYLSFKDNAREAMAFYHGVFGGDLQTTTFKEGQMSSGPDDDNKIMHSQLTAPNGMVLMGSDTPEGMGYSPGTNVSISLSGDNHAELSGYWEKLAQGATITMPLTPSPWGDTFGMLTDQFGIGWLVNIAQPKA